jgi:hypothetical protein
VAEKWQKVILSGSSALLNSVNIGLPSNGTYGGFFDGFNETTNLADALNEISLTFNAISDPPASQLTGQTLTLTGVISFQGKLAEGLDSNHFFGVTPNTQLTFHHSGTNLTFTTNNFRAGLNGNFTPNNILIGGVTGSLKFRDASSFTQLATRDLDLGNGITTSGDDSSITVANLSTFNNLFVDCIAIFKDIITTDDTGSAKYKVGADNNAGETNEFILRYVGNSTKHFPNQSITDVSGVVVSNEQKSFLSGVSYYDTGTIFSIEVTGSNMFNPVYATGTQGSFSSGFTNSRFRNQINPNHDDLYEKSFEIDVIEDKTSNDLTGASGLVILRKAGKSNVTNAPTLGIKGINSFPKTSTSQKSTDEEDIGVDNVENFFDESFRVTNTTGNNSRLNTTLIEDGELAVVNGKLFHGSKIINTEEAQNNAYDSNTFSDDNQSYFRKFTATSADILSGIFTYTYSNSFFSNISQAGSGGNLEMTFHVENDNNIYDLGREFGNNATSLGIFGIRESITLGNSGGGTTTIIVSFPVAEAGTSIPVGAKVVLQVKYNNNPSNNEPNISKITYRFGT